MVTGENGVVGVGEGEACMGDWDRGDARVGWLEKEYPMSVVSVIALRYPQKNTKMHLRAIICCSARVSSVANSDVATTLGTIYWVCEYNMYNV